MNKFKFHFCEELQSYFPDHVHQYIAEKLSETAYKVGTTYYNMSDVEFYIKNNQWIIDEIIV